MISLQDLFAYISNRQNTKLTLIAAVVSVVLLATLVKLSDFDRLLLSITALNLSSVLIAFFIFLLTIISVSLRLLFVLRLSIKKEVIPSFDITVIHTILLCVLPARLGDVCYPFLLNKNLNIILSHSFVNLLVLRLYDFMVSALLFLLSTVMLSIDMVDKILLQKAALLFLVIAAGVFGIIKYFPSILVISEKNIIKSAKTKKIFDFLHQLQEGFHAINIIDHMILFVMTCIKWLLSIGVIFFIFQSLNMDIQAGQTILVTTGMNLVVALPIQTIGGFGITEAAMAFLLGLVGYGTNEAVTLSLATRFIWLLMPLSVGVIWLIIRNTVLKNDVG